MREFHELVYARLFDNRLDEIVDMIDTFLDFYSSQVLNYYKFRTKQMARAAENEAENSEYFIIATSQKTLVEHLLKDLVLNHDLT